MSNPSEIFLARFWCTEYLLGDYPKCSDEASMLAVHKHFYKKS